MRSTSTLSRRTVLRGAAGATIALPLLEAMMPARRARAATAPRRFIVFFTPGGTVMSAWRPAGTETSFTLPAILSPLEPHKKNLIVLDGIDMPVCRDRTLAPHSRGMGALLTGQPLLPGMYDTDNGLYGFAAGPSVDQSIAAKISAGKKFKSLELGVRWATWEKALGKASPTNIINMQGPDTPIPPAIDPQAIWTRLFSGVGTDVNELTSQRQEDQSILDGVQKRYSSLMSRLGAADRMKLEAHLTKVRELELSLDAASPAAAACKKPVLGEAFDHNADASVPRAGKLMVDMLVMALRCDLSNVFTLMWIDSASYIKFPWLGITDRIHHTIQHANDSAQLIKIHKWFMEQLAYLLAQLSDPTDAEAGRTLLDSTIVFAGSELSNAPAHTEKDMPFLLAGGGGYFRTGRWVRYPQTAHNNLLVALQNAFGVESQTFGLAKYSTGPLPNLT